MQLLSKAMSHFMHKYYSVQILKKSIPIYTDSVCSEVEAHFSV